MNALQSTAPRRRLRVAFLTPSLHVGGAERWILALARNFQSVQPAGVVVCAPHAHPAMLEEAARLMPVYLARKFGDADQTRRLLRRACADADALLTWGVPRLHMVTRNLARRIGNPQSPVGRIDNPSYIEGNPSYVKGNPSDIPVIDVSHSDGRWTQQTKLVRRAASGADFHVAVSRCALGAFGPDIRRRATVIYNGAEVDRVAPRSVQRAKRTTQRGKVALFLGRFEKVKGFDRLFAAAKHLPDHWTILAHGHGRLGQSFCASHSAIRNGKVRICAPVAHVGDALAAADVLVMPSRHEGMPLTLVEAWLAGTPVVATPFGFVQEATEMHGPLCEVVPQNPTGEQLAGGILRAAQGRYVQAARNVAWNHYTAAAMAQRWEEYLHEACAVFGRSCSESAGAEDQRLKSES